MTTRANLFDRSRSPGNRTCKVCGACSPHAKDFASHDVCALCAGFDDLGVHHVAAGATPCRLRLWSHADGRAVGRASPGGLGNWHDDGLTDASPDVVPSTPELLAAVGPLVGSVLASLDASELDDGTIVVEFTPASRAEAAPKDGTLFGPPNAYEGGL